jgi:UDP-N-acetylmuramate dehydrogenase
MAVINELQARAKRNEPLSRYTTSRIGGPADLLVEARNGDELVLLAQRASEMEMPYLVLGGGANVLVSDAGVRGLVIINRSKEVKFTIKDTSARVEVDSGVNLITLARDCIEHGLAGLEWAIGVPGTVGGGIVGNAGAHGSDIASNLYMTRVMRRGYAPEWWTVRQMAFEYRSSVLRKYSYIERPIVVSAIFDMRRDNRTNLERRANEFNLKRKATQPPGATIGSMFKNPKGDYAGRLIEACKLKGHRMGGAMISPVHANFFVNVDRASGNDVLNLIELAQSTVRDQFGIELELEVELLGDWNKTKKSTEFLFELEDE